MKLIDCIIIVMMVVVYACQDVDSATPMNRATFARFYEDLTGIEGVIAKPNAQGFIVLSNSINETDTTGYLMQTDPMGNIIWKTSLVGTIVKSLATLSDGYFVLGDSIKVDPASDEIVDLLVYSIQVYKVNLNGSIMDKLTITDTGSNKKIDFKSSAITTNGQDEVIMLGTFLAPVLTAKEKPFLISINPNTLDTLWTQTYDVIDRDYVNGKSIYTTGDGHIIWASAILKEQQNFERSYISIPFVLEESTFVNNDVFGETIDQRLYVGDIVPASDPSFGYGVVGTYATPGGENSNMFFARVNSSGNFINGSVQFFDGQLSLGNINIPEGQSASQDSGDVITSTQDGGFVLAGTMTTTPQRGNGGKDIFLIKIDAFGNIVWNKVLGGLSDETISSITETEDGGLLLCGTKDAEGLPVLFLIKTNKDGEIIN